MRRLYIFLFLLTITVWSCKKDKPAINNGDNGGSGTTPPLTGPGIPILVSIDPQKPGANIPDDFLGFSYEAQMLTQNPEVLNKNNAVLIQLYKNIGPGIIRIGGDSSDEMDWNADQRLASTSNQTLTATEMDNLATFSKAVNWKVMLSLNFGSFNPATAASESAYATRVLGNNLSALQIGNEPDVYAAYSLLRPLDYKYADYNAEWLQYYNTIRASVPSAKFVGPDASYNTDWYNSFTNSLNDKVSQFTFHYYRTGPASNPSIDYTNLFGADWKWTNILNSLTNSVTTYKLPFRITESNSVYGSGKPGVSDTFAASLWSLDFLWNLAKNGGAGINLHNVMGSSYSAVDYQMLTPKPEYYSLLAFKYAANSGIVLPVKLDQTQYDLGVYACIRGDQTYAVTLINKESRDFSFTIDPNRIVNNVKTARLTAPGVTSKTDVMFAQSTVNPDGTFTPGTMETSVANSHRFLVTVPAYSAAVAVFN